MALTCYKTCVDVRRRQNARRVGGGHGDVGEPGGSGDGNGNGEPDEGGDEEAEDAL
ncbi:hypothetical protein DPMN_115495 [Dreissena polymorpha]|uniref:Uncharacterized protein n=1 Tax=Dreissena polymorpha TaxID=45954 RepID=A0A9D4KMJ9_DREPO|nr:hypothetical protein DPMN_115495 [Dreissena polymorpha]